MSNVLLSGEPGGDSDAFSKVLYRAPNPTTACRIEASEWLSCSTLRVQNSESKNPESSFAVCVRKTWKYWPSWTSNDKAPGAYIVGERCSIKVDEAEVGGEVGRGRWTVRLGFRGAIDKAAGGEVDDPE